MQEFDLTPSPRWINDAANTIMGEVIAATAPDADLSDPEDYASLRGAIEGVIMRALPATREAGERGRVERAEARLRTWRSMYISLVEAIAAEAKARPTLRLGAVEARLVENQKIIVDDANTALAAYEVDRSTPPPSAPPVSGKCPTCGSDDPALVEHHDYEGVPPYCPDPFHATPRAGASEGEAVAWGVENARAAMEPNHFHLSLADAQNHLAYLNQTGSIGRDRPYRIVPLYARHTPPQTVDKPKRVIVYPHLGYGRDGSLTYGKTYDVIRWDDSDAKPRRYPVVLDDNGNEYRLTETKWEAVR